MAQLTHQLGIEKLEQCWQQVIGQPLPDAVRTYVSSYRPEGGESYRPEGGEESRG